MDVVTDGVASVRLEVFGSALVSLDCAVVVGVRFVSNCDVVSGLSAAASESESSSLSQPTSSSCVVADADHSISTPIPKHSLSLLFRNSPFSSSFRLVSRSSTT